MSSSCGNGFRLSCSTPASPCMWRRCMATTATISPSLATKHWPTRCARQSNWILARITNSLNQRYSSGLKPMKIFTAHRPPQASQEEAVFIKEGFSWPAFFFPVIWLVLKRLWLPLIIYLLALALICALAAGCLFPIPSSSFCPGDQSACWAWKAMSVGAVPWQDAVSSRKVHSSAKIFRKRN